MSVTFLQDSGQADSGPEFMVAGVERLTGDAPFPTMM
jgi:hypothetical protein